MCVSVRGLIDFRATSLYLETLVISRIWMHLGDAHFRSTNETPGGFGVCPHESHSACFLHVHRSFGQRILFTRSIANVKFLAMLIQQRHVRTGQTVLRSVPGRKVYIYIHGVHLQQHSGSNEAQGPTISESWVTVACQSQSHGSRGRKD